MTAKDEDLICFLVERVDDSASRVHYTTMGIRY
jgi:hypothetical protein